MLSLPPPEIFQLISKSFLKIILYFHGSKQFASNDENTKKASKNS